LKSSGVFETFATSYAFLPMLTSSAAARVLFAASAASALAYLIASSANPISDEICARR